jgi:hypothetical protein
LAIDPHENANIPPLVPLVKTAINIPLRVSARRFAAVEKIHGKNQSLYCRFARSSDLSQWMKGHFRE